MNIFGNNWFQNFCFRQRWVSNRLGKSRIVKFSLFCVNLNKVRMNFKKLSKKNVTYKKERKNKSNKLHVVCISNYNTFDWCKHHYSFDKIYPRNSYKKFSKNFLLYLWCRIYNKLQSTIFHFLFRVTEAYSWVYIILSPVWKLSQVHGIGFKGDTSKYFQGLRSTLSVKGALHQPCLL